MKKLLAPAIALLALTGCSGAEESVQTNNETAAAPEEAESAQAPDLAGAWVQSNPNSEDSFQQAEIADGRITVDWVSDGGDTTSIYWVGTFEAPTNAAGPYVWTSERDEEATENALLASTTDTKEFTYEDGEITYEVTALGTTTKVTLEKE